MKSQPVYSYLKPKKGIPFGPSFEVYIEYQPRPQGFSTHFLKEVERVPPRDERETRVTGNEAQIFMERETCGYEAGCIGLCKGFMCLCRDTGGLFSLHNVKPCTT